MSEAASLFFGLKPKAGAVAQFRQMVERDFRNAAPIEVLVKVNAQQVVQEFQKVRNQANPEIDQLKRKIEELQQQVNKSGQSSKAQASSIADYYKQQAASLRNFIQSGYVSLDQGRVQGEALQSRLKNLIQLAQQTGASSGDINKFSQALANVSRTLGYLSGNNAPLSFGDLIKRQLDGLQKEYTKLQQAAQVTGQSNVQAFAGLQRQLQQIETQIRSTGQATQSELSSIRQLGAQVNQSLGTGISQQLKNLQDEYQRLGQAGRTAGQDNVNALNRIQSELTELQTAFHRTGQTAIGELQKIRQLSNQVANDVRKSTSNLNDGLAALGSGFAAQQLARGLASVATEAGRAEATHRLFLNVVRRSGEDINYANKQIDSLSKNFQVVKPTAEEAMTQLRRIGFTVDQATQALKLGAASALVAGKTSAEGFEAIKNTAATGLSLYLNYIGIAENVGPTLQKVERATKDKTKAEQDAARATAILSILQKAAGAELKDVDAILSGIIGTQNRYNTALQEARIVLGQSVIPSYTKLVTVATESLRTFTQLPGPVKDATVALAGMVVVITGAAGLVTAFNVLKPAMLLLFAPPQGIFILAVAAIGALAAARWSSIRQEADATAKSMKEFADKTGIAVEKVKEGRLAFLQGDEVRLKSRISQLESSLANNKDAPKYMTDEARLELQELKTELENVQRTMAAIRRGGGILSADEANRNTDALKKTGDQFEILVKKARELKAAQDAAAKTNGVRDDVKISQEIDKFVKSSELASEIWTAINAQIKQIAQESRTITKDFNSVLRDFAGGKAVRMSRGGDVGERHPIRGGLPHDGLDIVIPGGMGARVFNPFENARVMAVSTSKIYGNMVELALENGRSAFLGHFKDIAVEAGQVLNQGAFLGTQGSTGRSTGPHLHIGLKINGKTIFDPSVFRQELVSLAGTTTSTFYDAMGQSVTKNIDPLADLFDKVSQEKFKKALEQSSDAQLGKLKDRFLTGAKDSKAAGNFEDATAQGQKYLEVLAEIGRREELEAQKAKRTADELKALRTAQANVFKGIADDKFADSLSNKTTSQLKALRSSTEAAVNQAKTTEDVTRASQRYLAVLAELERREEQVKAKRIKATDELVAQVTKQQGTSYFIKYAQDAEKLRENIEKAKQAANALKADLVQENNKEVPNYFLDLARGAPALQDFLNRQNEESIEQVRENVVQAPNYFSEMAGVDPTAKFQKASDDRKKLIDAVNALDRGPFNPNFEFSLADAATVAREAILAETDALAQLNAARTALDKGPFNPRFESVGTGEEARLATLREISLELIRVNEIITGMDRGPFNPGFDFFGTNEDAATQAARDLLEASAALNELRTNPDKGPFNPQFEFTLKDPEIVAREALQELAIALADENARAIAFDKGPFNPKFEFVGTNEEAAEKTQRQALEDLARINELITSRDRGPFNPQFEFKDQLTIAREEAEALTEEVLRLNKAFTDLDKGPFNVNFEFSLVDPAELARQALLEASAQDNARATAFDKGPFNPRFEFIGDNEEAARVTLEQNTAALMALNATITGGDKGPFNPNFEFDPTPSETQIRVANENLQKFVGGLQTATGALANFKTAFDENASPGARIGGAAQGIGSLIGLVDPGIGAIVSVVGGFLGSIVDVLTGSDREKEAEAERRREQARNVPAVHFTVEQVNHYNLSFAALDYKAKETMRGISREAAVETVKALGTLRDKVQGGQS